MREPDQRMFGPLGFRVTSYLVALLSLLEVFVAVAQGEYFLLLAGLGGVFMAYWIYKSSRGKDQEKARPDNPTRPPPRDGGS